MPFMTKAIALTCPECGAPFEPTQLRQLFCSPAHKKATANRKLGRSAIVQLGQVWRAARGSKDPGVRAAGKLAFALMCRRLDEANTEDRLAGRLNPVALFIRQQDAGLLNF